MAARTEKRNIVVAMAVGLVVATAYPLVDLALSCRAPQSEACVWGKAYLPLTFGLSIPIVGTLAAAVTYALIAWVARRKRVRSASGS